MDGEVVNKKTSDKAGGGTGAVSKGAVNKGIINRTSRRQSFAVPRSKFFLKDGSNLYAEVSYCTRI